MTTGERLIKISKTLLMIWGGISFIGIILLAILFFHPTALTSLGNESETDKATKEDVRFVLNWCGLGDQRIDKVLKSYVSSRSFTGDYHDAYSIKITDVTVDEMSNDNGLSGKWYRMDSLPTVLNEAVSFIGGWQHETPWFPTEDSLRTKDFYVYPWSIYCHGITPSATELIFINPTDKIVYYVGAKM